MQWTRVKSGSCRIKYWNWIIHTSENTLQHYDILILCLLYTSLPSSLIPAALLLAAHINPVLFVSSPIRRLANINEALCLLFYPSFKERIYRSSRDRCMYSEVTCLLHKTLYIPILHVGVMCKYNVPIECCSQYSMSLSSFGKELY